MAILTKKSKIFIKAKVIFMKSCLLQWLAKKLVVSISKIRNLAVGFLFFEIQKLI